MNILLNFELILFIFNMSGRPSLLLQQDPQQAEESDEHRDEPDGGWECEDSKRDLQSNEA